MTTPAVSAQETELEVIGRSVVRERQRRGWTQQTLADLAGLNRATIVNIENPQRERPPTLMSLLDVLAVLELQLAPVGAHRHDYEEVCRVCGQKRGAA